MNNKEIRESMIILKSQDTSNIPKGDYNGECNRGVCSTKNAYWYNAPMYKYYCIKCSRMINESSNQSGMGDICTPEYPNDSLVEDMSMENIEVQDVYHSYDRQYMSSTEIKKRPTATHPIRTTPKIDRNSKCHCDSGKKYKKCCINK